MKELNVDPKMVPPKALLSRISQAKNRLESAADLRRASESFADEQLAEVYERYARALTSSQALDFDDLLLKTVTLFKESDEARTRYGERFRYIMVDEYQDTNRPQYLLVRYLAERHRNLCVVGDPDQSIYKWRGADLRNILDFEDDFPETTVVRLERNYRSTQVILDAASGLIAHNRRRREKRLYTESAGGEPIVFHRASDDLEEADFILGQLRDAARGAGRRRALPHQRAVAGDRGSAGARGHPVPCGRRRPLLRTQGDQGRPRLPETVAESRRRRQPAPGHQRPGARDRFGGDDGAGRHRAPARP